MHWDLKLTCDENKNKPALACLQFWAMILCKKNFKNLEKPRVHLTNSQIF